MNDFLLDSTGDLQILNGDIVIGFSDDQNKEILLVTDKGSFKENPEVGVGLQSFLEAEDSSSDLQAEIRKQFTADGMTIDQLAIANGNYNLNAHY